LLKKEITCLTNDLRKCYDSRAKFNHCWASQKFTLNKQAVAEDNQKFRCGGAFLDYIHILYGNKSSQQDHRLEVP